MNTRFWINVIYGVTGITLIIYAILSFTVQDSQILGATQAFKNSILLFCLISVPILVIAGWYKTHKTKQVKIESKKVIKRYIGQWSESSARKTGIVYCPFEQCENKTMNGQCIYCDHAIKEETKI